jgi:RNase H-fold protein (predicted Holliday junction resolvase)
MQDLGINSSSKKNKLDENSAAFILQGFIDYLKK